jgi:hypothetical protein
MPSMSDQQVYIVIVEARVQAGLFARSLYLYQAPASAQAKYFLHLNGLAEHTELLPGTVVVVPSDPSGRCTVLESQVAAELNALRRQGRGLIEHPRTTNQLPDVLEFAASQTPGAFGAYSVAMGDKYKA